MMVLTVRAIEKLGELKAQGALDNLAQFSDENLLSEYAVDSAKYAVNAGLIKGNKEILNPLGSLTRAEAAVMLYRLFKSR